MDIFFPMIHFWPCTYDWHWPSLVILWCSELKKVSSKKLQEILCYNGKSFANSKLRLQSLCRRVKLNLMVSFWETRPTRMCTRTASPPKNTSWWSSLPQTEPACPDTQGMPLSVYQKVLEQSLVIIYGGLLWSLIADACSGHLCLIFSARLPTFQQKHQVVACS